MMTFTTRPGYAAAAPCGYRTPDPGGPWLPLSIPPDDLWEFLTESLDLIPERGTIGIPKR